MRKEGTWLLLAFLLFALPTFQGCASEQGQTVRETTTTDAAPPTENSTTTTTTETTTSNEPDSVLGATAHAVGTVILFPFRVAGDALELVF